MKFYILVLLFIFSCKLAPEFPSQPYNEYDFNNPNYTNPKITFLAGPINGSIIYVDEVKIKWVGNKNSMTFRYRFDNNAWSIYSPQDSILLQNIAIGNHIFYVQGKYINEVQGEMYKINFEKR